MKEYRRGSTYELTEIAMFVVILVICSWISIPAVIPFTMQTFAIFLSICVLGGKKTTMVIFLYLLMGCIGIPVFSGFRGGVGCLIGNTGGFLVGFLAASFVAWAIESIISFKPWIRWIQMIICIVICYVFGVMWYLGIANVALHYETIIPVISLYVVPFLIPDGIKMFTAYFVSKKVKGIMKNIYN